MNKVLCLAIMIVISFTLMTTLLVGQDLKAVSENEQTRLSRDEITKLMIQVGSVPVAEQNRKIDLLWADKAGDKTPRSDFLFCMGMAYLGNYKAQAYLGRAFEAGKGIVIDFYESYVWHSIALSNAVDDREAEQKIQSDKDRIKQLLVSVYPSPSDQELDELIEARKQEITECMAEI